MPNASVLPSRRKGASLGGDGQDGSFEQAFATIARAHVQDRAPALMDYEVGFQLLDRDDKANTAAGVFGFKAGPSWLFVPVFYLDGDIKGHELLYIRAKDQFCPLKENWIDSLLSRAPSAIGDPVERDVSRRGVRSPDLSVLTRGPKAAAVRGRLVRWADGEKAALEAEAAGLSANLEGRDRAAFEAWPAWARVGVASLLKAAAREGDVSALDVASRSPEGLNAFLQFFDERPRYREDLVTMYGPAALKQAVKRAAERDARRRERAGRRAKAAALAPGGILAELEADARAKLAVHRRRPGESARDLAARLPADLDDVDRSRLLAGEVVFKDARDEREVSHAFEVPSREKLAAEILANPARTGIYDVMTAGGGSERCLVVVAPQGPNPTAGGCVVVRTEGHTWRCATTGDVWVTGEADLDEFDAFLDELPEADGLGDGEDARCLLIGETAATWPLERRGKIGPDLYEVSFDSYIPRASGPFRTPSAPLEEPDRPWPQHTARLRLGEPGTRLSRVNGELMVPSSFRRLSLSGRGSLDLGSPGDVELAMRKAGAVTLDLVGVGSRVKVAGHTMDRDEALVGLVARFGLREGPARELLKRAAASRRPVRVWLKTADLYNGGNIYLTGPGASTPAWPDPPMGEQRTLRGSLPVIFSQQDRIPVDDLAPRHDAQQAYDPLVNDEEAMRNSYGILGRAMDAAREGKRELFDASAIGAISRLMRPAHEDTLIDDDLDIMTKALSALGRQLLKSYRHGSVYESRYGRDDIAELTDSLRSNFESLGDLVLTMKQKTIDADPGDAAREVDLEPSARA